MLLDHGTTHLESLNPLDATTFGIEINEFTFDLLIKKLYSNPIESVIRELVSNAWDSHVAAGKTHVAITVNAPTLFDPYFTVHDYGTGLSHEDMTTLYNTICRSDRRGSNSFLGGFGLGSKSPFAYSDQFTVESRYNGWKKLYAVYKDGNNIPTISLMSNSATNEHNGLTVKIPVATHDHYKFIGAIQKELLYFPNINTNTTITPPPVIWTSTDNTITLTKSTPQFNEGLYAVVGHVIYQIDTRERFKWISFLNSTYAWKCNLFIHCEVGQLSITPNRENLQYNNTTTTYLENTLRNAKKQIHTYIEETLLQCPTYNAACKQLVPMRSILNSIGWWNDSFRHPEQPNEPISSYIIIPLPEEVEAACTTKSRRGPLRIGYWINKNNLKIAIDNEDELLWCPKKTPYLAERLRNIPHTTHTKLILRGGDQDTLTELFNNELLTPVVTDNLSDYRIEPRTSSNRKGLIKTLTSDTINTNELDPDYDAYLCINNDCVVYQERQYSLYTITGAKNTLDNFADYRIRHIALLPKSRWNSKITKELPDALPLITQRITQLVNLYDDEIKNTLLLQNNIHKRTLISLAKKYQHDLRHSPFFTGLQQFKETPYRIQNLIQTAYEFRIPLPEPDNTQLEAHNAFYQRYKPFIDYDINVDDHATLLHAYEKYLEQTTDV